MDDTKYWILVNGEIAGPFNKSSLLERDIQNDDLIWTKGFSDWTRADSVEELNTVTKSSSEREDALDKKQYYLVREDKPDGPYSLKEIESLKLNHDELVWRHGYEDWKAAGSISELSGLTKPSDIPPIPGKKLKRRSGRSINEHNARIGKDESGPILTRDINGQRIEDRSDLSDQYSKAPSKSLGEDFMGGISATSFAICSIACNILMYVFAIWNMVSVVIFMGLISIIAYVVCIIWATKLAAIKNRDSTLWGFISFLFGGAWPLIVIDQMSAKE